MSFFFVSFPSLFLHLIKVRGDESPMIVQVDLPVHVSAFVACTFVWERGRGTVLLAGGRRRLALGREKI